MKASAVSISLILFILCFTATNAKIKQGSYVARNNYGSRLELNGMVYNGAGQDWNGEGFKNYFNAMSEQTKPSIYMYYLQLKDLNINDFTNLAKELDYYKNKYKICLIPQIGLSMTYGLAPGEGSSCYDEDVAKGLYDDRIDFLCRSMAAIGYPFFLRIGVEFNGLSWYGYSPKSYVQAFKRITDAVRKYNLDAATVWNAAYNSTDNWSQAKGLTLDNEKYAYMEYYPGDDYVDWWGLSMFQPDVFKHAITNKFLTNAQKHEKPVMISESTPIFIGTNDGQKGWNSWFRLYFDFIRSQPNVKAFCYINWEWEQKSKEYNLPWADWGDCRIEANDTVLSLYKEEMKNPLYFHGQDEKAFRKALGIQDDLLPSKVKNIITVFNKTGLDLNWQPAEDNTGILRYEILRKDKIISNATQCSYQDKNIKAGSAFTYSITAVDMGGNKGNPAYTTKIIIPDSIEKVTNGNFESDYSAWTVRQWYGENLKFSIETKNPLVGNASAKLFVEKAIGTDWHVQFGQFFQSYKGMIYILSFTIKVDTEAEINVLLQQVHEPYAAIIFQTIKADKTAKKYTFVNTSPAEDDQLFLAFMCGKANQRTIYLDDVSLTETVEK